MFQTLFNFVVLIYKTVDNAPLYSYNLILVNRRTIQDGNKWDVQEAVIEKQGKEEPVGIFMQSLKT